MWRCCTATWATPSAAPTGGASRPARCRWSSAPGAPSSPRRGRFHALSAQLESAMRHALGSGGQVILLLNRRGFSTHLHCPACGFVEQCKFCDLALTFHRYRDVALCHHCGYETPPPQKCPKCGQAQVRYQGSGTEKLQAEVEEKFQGYVVRRMDSDTMRRPGSHASLLGAFRKGEVHI